MTTAFKRIIAAAEETFAEESMVQIAVFQVVAATYKVCGQIPDGFDYDEGRYSQTVRDEFRRIRAQKKAKDNNTPQTLCSE